MFDFLKRVFGQSSVARHVSDTTFAKTGSSVGSTGRDDAVQPAHEASKAKRLLGAAAVDRYFELSNVIEAAKADGDFGTAIRAARETYPLIGAVVQQMKKEYGSFDICTSHAVHSGGTLMAVIGERQGISELRAVLNATPELRQWLPVGERAQADADLVDAIMAAVNDQPGIKQNDLKGRVSGDGRRLSTLASWLEKGKRLRRVSVGSTYMLYPPWFSLDSRVSESVPVPKDKRSSESISLPVHRRGPSRSAARARKINFTGLAYIRLPKAPNAWEEPLRGQSHATADGSTSLPRSDRDADGSKPPRFTVTGDGWMLTREEPLSPEKRPNAAYRETFHTAGSTIWLDPKGRRQQFPTAPAVALTTDRAGAPLAEKELAYDVYRADVNADGSGMLFLSRDGILHGYTEMLESILAERVADLPEFGEQAKRLRIDPGSLKNHVRCVALSQDRLRYVITIVDEAWCYDLTIGRPIWGLRFPSKEGWIEIAAKRSERHGPSTEVIAALQLMELALPISPEAITRQYKTLAMRWHPDHNPNDPESTRKFQELGAAMELLTGVELSGLSGQEVAGVAYQQILHKSSVSLPEGVKLTISMTLQIGGAFGADWIYAANFVQGGHNSFLAGYSGRVIEVDAAGLPLRVYDIGAVPRQVAKSSSHLFILTDTRLYILQQDQLVALVDVLGQGKLIIGDRGFGLLQTKQFQWFTHTGQLLGEVKTRDPIRRTYSGAEGLVVETRTHRGIVGGAQSWW
ncbi:MAG TPA: J domain-containing protein [Candidatus Dormibacteraeota bacterium]|nr:J domain-containing protein [Candidatus Dormibacteraeota bacterium]